MWYAVVNRFGFFCRPQELSKGFETCGEGGVTVIWWLETGDAAKYATVRRATQPPERKTYPAPDNLITEVKKPWIRGRRDWIMGRPFRKLSQ